MKDITVTGINFSPDRQDIMFHTNKNGRYLMSGDSPIYEVYGELMDLMNVKVDHFKEIESEEGITFEFSTCKGVVCFEWMGDAYLEKV